MSAAFGDWGLQIAGPHHADALILQATYAYEQAWPAHDPGHDR